MREQTLTMALIAFFGAFGCLARYALSTAVHSLAGRAFPYGTLAVNGAGAFFIGLVMEFSLRSALVPPLLRIGLTVGFLGGFTTFSSFSYETLRLLEEGQMAMALLNATANVTLCLILTWMGIVVARIL